MGRVQINLKTKHPEMPPKLTDEGGQIGAFQGILSLRSLWTQALLVALGWQTVMTIVGILLEYNFTNLDPSSLTPLSHTLHWDGGWFFAIIAENAYNTDPAAPVFYPLFPLLVTIMQTLSLNLLSLTAAVLVINSLALWLAVAALVRIIEHFGAAKYKWLAVALFLTFPTAIFLHFVYAETVFCALAFWAYLFALRRQWLHMAALLSLLLIVKIPALLVIGLCGLEYMRAHDWSFKKMLNKSLLALGIVPLGFVAYGLYLQSIRGDFLAMLHGYELTTDWSYHVFNPNFLLPIIEATKTVVLAVLGRAADYPGFVFIGALLPLTGLVLVGAASLYALIAVKGRAIPLGIAGLVSIVFFSINSNLVSVHRYVLPSLVLYIVPILLIQQYPKLYRWSYAAITLCVGLQGILYWFFVSGRFAG